jgi:hypothetical protein
MDLHSQMALTDVYDFSMGLYLLVLVYSLVLISLIAIRQQEFYTRFKNRDRSLNQSDRRKRGFNRSRFLNYKTRVVFKIFSNTNTLSEILINSEIIRGASQYTKCGGCRGYYGNNINKFGKKQFSSLKCAKTFQKK